MLRRLTLGFFALALAAFAAACSSSDTAPLSSGGVPGIGPNFASNSIYATNSTQNSVSIYAPNPATGASPVNQIGGSNTQLNGPQYDAFDSASRLYVTNFNAAVGAQAAAITIYQKFATGNVNALAVITGPFTQLVQPRGIALSASGTIVVANVNPSSPNPNQVLLFGSILAGGAGNITPGIIAGPATLLNSPTGVALDKNNNVFVANRGNGTVTEYTFPSPSPAPSGSPTASPSPLPTGSASPTPPPANALNLAPSLVISGGLVAPTGLAIDAAGNLYVADPDNGTPSIRVFAAGGTVPTRIITGSATTLSFPTDVKVDAAGNIYVADAGTNKILIFAPGANGNVAPTASVAAPGSLTGLALSP